MKSLKHVITIGGIIAASLSNAQEKGASIGTTPVPAKEDQARSPMAVRSLLEKGAASGLLPEGMVIRVGACLGDPDEKSSGKKLSDELRENWEFTAKEVRRTVTGADGEAERTESRSFEPKELCKILLEGKALEIRERKGEGPEVGFVGSDYHHGTRSIEVVWEGKTVLTLIETNGPTLHLYRESDARAFGALYERLASQARVLFTPEAAPAKHGNIIWGEAVNGLQIGISPQTGERGESVAVFDGRTLQFDVRLRNAGKARVEIIPNKFGCAAVGGGGAIPVTKFVLTPLQGGEPISVTYRGANHVGGKRPLDADDVKYFATVLEPGQAAEYPYAVSFTPGADRTTSWQRPDGSNLVPDGKYQLKAILAVDRKESEWKGEVTSGALEVEIAAGKK